MGASLPVGPRVEISPEQAEIVSKVVAEWQNRTTRIKPYQESRESLPYEITKIPMSEVTGKRRIKLRD